MRRRVRRLIPTCFAAAACAAVLPAAAGAQLLPVPEAAARGDEAPPSRHRNVVAASPLFAMLGFYTAEYERALPPRASIALGGSSSAIGPFSYRSADAKVRFYPGERVLEGFSVGVSAGMIGVSSSTVPRGSGGFSTSGVAVGTEVGYSWLMGRRGNLAVGVGGGFKRIVRLAGHDVSGLHLTLPTMRASFGIAF